MRRTLGVLYVLAAAAAAAPALAALATSDIGGRWQGTNYRMAARSADCGDGGCKLTLDIVPCGKDWCGIEVADDSSCGGTAMKVSTMAAAEDEPAAGLTFEGTLALAHGTEPYVIRAWLGEANEGEKATLHLTGDTGGEFRMFRRSFPFHATLARVGDAICKDAKPTS